jgi:hypothetical protein
MAGGTGVSASPCRGLRTATRPTLLEQNRYASVNLSRLRCVSPCIHTAAAGPGTVEQHRGHAMSTLNRSAAGVALLAALAAGCGSVAAMHTSGSHPEPSSSAPARHHSSSKPAASASPSKAPQPAAAPHQAAPPPAMTPPPAMAPPPAAPAAPAQPPVMTPVPHQAPPSPPVNPIPQGNAGDHDGDNNGAPSDGDGGI